MVFLNIFEMLIQFSQAIFCNMWFAVSDVYFFISDIKVSPFHLHKQVP